MGAAMRRRLPRLMAEAALFLLALLAALLVLLTLAVAIILVLILVGHDWFLSSVAAVNDGASLTCLNQTQGSLGGSSGSI